jgi:hypothetical protein
MSLENGMGLIADMGSLFVRDVARSLGAANKAKGGYCVVPIFEGETAAWSRKLARRDGLTL